MTITVRKNADGAWQALSGAQRLAATLDVLGKADVVDADTGEAFVVHDVDGQLLILSAEHDANLDDLANAVVNQARRTSEPGHD